MKKKWSSDKVRVVQKWLLERWPEIFTIAPDMKPLSLNIYRDILEFRDENPQLSGRVLREVLKRHTSSYGYLYGMLKYSHRYNLSGEQGDAIAAEHRAWAKNTLKSKQKVAQKVRKSRGQKAALVHSDRNSDRNSGRNFRPRQVSGETLAGRTVRKAPVIRYKQPKRKQIGNSRQLDLLAG